MDDPIDILIDLGLVDKPKRGLARKTMELQENLLYLLSTMDKPVTVRQMFYQASVNSFVEKEESGYRKVQRELLRLRREGRIQYNWIADNTRWQRKPTTYNSLVDCLEETARFYRQSIWRDINQHVEVWCEKDALAGVIYPITAEYDVPLMVAKGYSSESFVFQSAEYIKSTGKPATIYYVGDFDPSGWHMSTDLQSKFSAFGVQVSFIRLGINPEHLEWGLPSRPTKATDTRTKGFYKLFGENTPSIELDALHPDKLRSMIREAIEAHVPDNLLESIDHEENAARSALFEFMGECE